MYYMTSKRNQEISHWLPCKARTLSGAKREATRELSSGYVDATLMVAGDFEDGSGDDRLQVLVEKLNQPGGKWKVR